MVGRRVNFFHCCSTGKSHLLLPEMGWKFGGHPLPSLTIPSHVPLMREGDGGGGGIVLLLLSLSSGLRLTVVTVIFSLPFLSSPHFSLTAIVSNSFYMLLLFSILLPLFPDLYHFFHRILGLPRSLPLLKSLHWLPVHYRIIVNVCTVAYEALSSAQPAYLNSMLTPAKIPDSYDRSVVTLFIFTFLGCKLKLEPELFL